MKSDTIACRFIQYTTDIMYQNIFRILVLHACIPYILYAKQKHLGCKKGEANQKQQLSDYKSIHSYTCD